MQGVSGEPLRRRPSRPRSARTDQPPHPGVGRERLAVDQRLGQPLRLVAQLWSDGSPRATAPSSAAPQPRFPADARKPQAREPERVPSSGAGSPGCSAALSRTSRGARVGKEPFRTPHVPSLICARVLAVLGVKTRRWVVDSVHDDDPVELADPWHEAIVASRSHEETCWRGLPRRSPSRPRIPPGRPFT